MTDLAFLLNPFAARQVVLRSRLAPEECVERLRGQLVPRYRWNPLAREKQGPLIGEIVQEAFSAAKHTRHFRNSFRPVAMGQFTPEGDGTRIDIRLGVHPQALALIFIFAAVALFLTFAAAQSSTSPVETLFPLGMFIVALAMFALARFISRNEDIFLVRHLADLFEATVEPPGALHGQW